MWPYAKFRNPLTRVVSDYVRSKYTLTEPLPEHWLGLLATLEGPGEARSPDTGGEARAEVAQAEPSLEQALGPQCQRVDLVPPSMDATVTAKDETAETG